jgi:hypothetical protein
MSESVSKNVIEIEGGEFGEMSESVSKNVEGSLGK